MMIPPTVIKMMLAQVRETYTPEMGRDAARALKATTPDDVPLVAQVLRDVLAELDNAPTALRLEA